MHGTPLMLAWFVFANLTFLIGSIRWFKYSFIVHLILGLTVLGLTLLGTVHVILEGGIDVPEGTGPRFQKIHNIIGLVVTIWVGIQALTGLAARIIQYYEIVSPFFCYWTKRVHWISSYGIMLFAKFNYMIINYRRHKYGRITFYILVDLLFLMAYFLLKFKYWNFS